MALTIAAMTAEIRENNINKGWRPAGGGPGNNTLGDYTALLHTEIAEATEAYRSHRLDDVSRPVCGWAATDWYWEPGADRTGRVEEPCTEHGLSKPEGVGSELADVLIRLLDTGDVFGLQVADPDFELGDVADLDPKIADEDLPGLVTFADHMAWLHRRADRIWTNHSTGPAWTLRALLTVARKYGIDLDTEYARKMAYNRLRPFQHGGRTLSGTSA